jgi:hypothetical protein
VRPSPTMVTPRVVQELQAELRNMRSARDQLTVQIAELERFLATVGAPVRRGPGRPPGSGIKRGPGRPPKSSVSLALPIRRGPGRPKGSKNKRGPGRPAGSKNKTKGTRKWSKEAREAARQRMIRRWADRKKKAKG